MDNKEIKEIIKIVSNNVGISGNVNFRGIEEDLESLQSNSVTDELPDFLYEDDEDIKVGVHGDSIVTDEWNKFIKLTQESPTDEQEEKELSVEEFLKFISGYYGEETKHIDQIVMMKFNGEELFELLTDYKKQLK